MSAKAKPEKDPFEDALTVTLPFMVRMKALMIKKNTLKESLPCPRPGCEGRVRAVLAGPRKHIHFACTEPPTKCFVRGME